MLKIYGVYRSRASRNFWLAGELGLPFEHIPVMQANRLADPGAADAPFNTRSPAFLEIAPGGQIPVIADGDVVVSESLAINLYLARKHGGPLAPASIAEEAKMLQWSMWAATAFEPHSIQIVYHRVGNPTGVLNPAIAAAAVAGLRAPVAILDKALSSTGFLVGGRFTVADINVAEIVRYALPAPELFEHAPHVSGWIAACHARPAFKAMMAQRETEPA